MVSHNNVIPNQHFKKKWQFYVKTWFNQPARKTRRQKGQCCIGVQQLLNRHNPSAVFELLLDLQLVLRRRGRFSLVL